MSENSETRWLYESALMKLEASNRRGFILAVILLIVLLATNGGWLYYESQFRTEVQTTSTVQMIDAEQDADGGGNNILVGGNYGETKSKSDDGNNDND